MARQPSDDKVGQREVVRERVKFLLDYHWGGNQRQMARDLGVSQGLISKVVNGLQGAGRGFLNKLARQPGVNADWVLRGEGQPLSLPPLVSTQVEEASRNPRIPLHCADASFRFIRGYPRIVLRTQVE